MDNIYDMLARTNLLDEIMENERKEAAKRLRNDLGAFIAHYGNVLIIRNGEEGEEVDLEKLSIEEMESLYKFMVDTLNNDIQYQEDEIDRYINLCL